ncbi:MAG: DNA adenine methylase [Chloroflexi bacterium]|nr:DNA adenine methylase [Chloroflexota bacterium]
MARSSTSYHSKWKAGSTTVIRVPSKLASEVLRYAHELDEKCNGNELREPVAAYRTADDVALSEPVNVASVPQRSPFRYPGGKTWLVPYIRSWLQNKSPRPSVLVEPFAGGGIVGLTAGFEKLADHVVMVESNPNVAAVWQAIFCGQSSWLAQSIAHFELTNANVLSVLRSEPTSQRERAFATILRNRVQRGGIMASGAGLVKTGENGRGINSRWYPETLARRIQEIAQIRDRFSFIEGDGIEVIRRYSDVDDASFFVDPPYTTAARRLYQHWQVDHRSLFALLAEVKGEVLLTYDNTREIAALASGSGFQTQAVTPRSASEPKMSKLLIGRNLAKWLKPSN